MKELQKRAIYNQKILRRKSHRFENSIGSDNLKLVTIPRKLGIGGSLPACQSSQERKKREQRSFNLHFLDIECKKA